MHEVEKYLCNLIEKEEKLFNKNIKQFYYEYKIVFTPIFFPTFYKENFFLVLKFKNFGIYYNDIEEDFGICRIDNDECVKYAEFFDDLTPTIQKFKDFILNKRLDELVS